MPGNPTATVSASDGVDPLTELELREAFDAALVRETAFARRHNVQLAIFLFELDGLEAVRSAHGAEAAERVLAEAGRLLKELASSEFVVAARLSGEMFGLLIRGLGATALEAEAERLRAGLAGMKLPEGVVPGQVTATFGIASFHTARAATPEVMLHAAEAALLDARKLGKNRTLVHAEGLPAPAATPPV